MPARMARRDAALAPVTLDDVAVAAGVSTATVSRVINNLPRVADTTRQRVLDTIEQLHYAPNFAGRTLATRRSRTLGLIISDITNPFYPAVMRGVEVAALNLGFSVLLYDTAENTQREAQALQLLRERQVDGLVICSSRLGSARLAALSQGKTPIVFINSQPAPSAVGSVETDHEAGMRAAVEHLVQLGHRRVAYLGGPPTSHVQQRRLKAFRYATRYLGAFPLERCCPPTVEGGTVGAEELLAEPNPNLRSTAFITYNDLMASGALLAARAHGLRVPEELSLIGHDDIPMAALLWPPLTTVRQPMEDLGSRAVAMLGTHLQRSVAAHPTILSLHPELVIRASTAPPPDSADLHANRPVELVRTSRRWRVARRNAAV